MFNRLTGSYEYVGNWSGVTVEKKIGKLKRLYGHLIDLPGVYSLNPVTKDEQVVIQFFLNESVPAIINIVDASQFERNLQLTIQLLEMNKPLMIGLNMVDVAKMRGIHIDEKKLSEFLGVDVQPIIARTGKGCSTLIERIVNLPDKTVSFQLNYGDVIEKGIQQFIELLGGRKFGDLPSRWLALQFFDKNESVWNYLEQFVDREALSDLYNNTDAALKKEGNNNAGLQQAIFLTREKFFRKAFEHSVTLEKKERPTWTEKIDRIVTNKYLGIPLFLFFLYLMFMMTFNWVGTPLSDLLDEVISGPFTDWLGKGLEAAGASSLLMNLVLDGIVPGVGGVLVFIPQIFILFFFISILEDSGYMARISLVMDRIMEGFGLNGKSFIPMIIGFGCNVPGIMSARTIEQPKERLITILLTPLMSCSARLPIYALFAGTFFVKNQAMVVLSLYVLGAFSFY